MKNVKRIGFAALTVAVIVGMLYLFLPHSVESVAGYDLNSFRCGVMAVTEQMNERSCDLDREQQAAVVNVLSAIKLQRTFEKGNVIHHKDGFGWYSIAFADGKGQVFQPTVQVDSDGDVFIDNVKYEIADEEKKAELLEILASICGQ